MSGFLVTRGSVFTCSSGLLRLFALLLALCLLDAARGFSEELDFSGSVEVGGTYDTNVFLTAADYDFEVRQISGETPEEEDFLGYLRGDFRLAIPVSEGVHQDLRYLVSVDRFDDFTKENREKHRIEVLPSFRLTEDLKLFLEYDFEYDNRRRGAEYLRPDYEQHQAGGGMRWTPSSEDAFTVRYLHEDRDYDFVPETTFDDYDGDIGELSYERKFGRRTLGKIGFFYMRRDYADDTMDPFGDLIFGRSRIDYRNEVKLAITHLPTAKTLFQVGYLYRNHWATGEFYDYDLNRVIGIWVQQLPWQVRLQTYLHYDWKDYDFQEAKRITFPDDLPTEELIGETRSDNQLLLLVNLTKELKKGFACGVEFQHLDNSSNDDSSEYEAQRYSVFGRYSF